MRLTRDVAIAFIDPKWEGPWLSPDDYERLREPLVVLEGTIGVKRSEPRNATAWPAPTER